MIFTETGIRSRPALARWLGRHAHAHGSSRHGFFNERDAGRSLLDEIVRDGAQRMLAAALRAEVAAYIEGFADHVDEKSRRLVVRNGYHAERIVLTAAGAVAVKAPRVNDRRVDPETGELQGFHRRFCRRGRASRRR